MSASPPPRGRTAVVGHVEYVTFIGVERLPGGGEVVHGQAPFARAGGGGGVACAMLAELGAEVDLFCAFGADEAGARATEQLSGRGVHVHAATRAEPSRRAITLLQRGGERAIVTLGERLAPRGEDDLPWERIEAAGAVYFTAGDLGALHHARRTRVLVATPRARDALAAGPGIDALVYSDGDPDERAWAERLAGRARILVATQGEAGGHWWGESEGRWAAVAPPGPVMDTYGAGDTFAAVLAHELGTGRPMADAAAEAARWGALATTRPGAP